MYLQQQPLILKQSASNELSLSPSPPCQSVSDCRSTRTPTRAPSIPHRPKLCRSPHLPLLPVPRLSLTPPTNHNHVGPRTRPHHPRVLAYMRSPSSAPPPRSVRAHLAQQPLQFWTNRRARLTRLVHPHQWLAQPSHLARPSHPSHLVRPCPSHLAQSSPPRLVQPRPLHPARPRPPQLVRFNTSHLAWPRPPHLTWPHPMLLVWPNTSHLARPILLYIARPKLLWLAKPKPLSHAPPNLVGLTPPGLAFLVRLRHPIALLAGRPSTRTARAWSVELLQVPSQATYNQPQLLKQHKAGLTSTWAVQLLGFLHACALTSHTPTSSTTVLKSLQLLMHEQAAGEW
jgi:hypothetical protein